MKKFAILVGAALVAVVALTGCGGGGGGGGKVTDLGTVEMTDDFKFVPANLSGGVGEFKVKLVNKGVQVHDFSVSGTSVKFEVPGGKTVEKTFKIDKAGPYQIICNQPGHKDGGMVGTLEVK